MEATEALEPGDILILAGRDGYWCGGYEYVGADETAADRLIVRHPQTGALFSARRDMATKPTVTGRDGGVGPAESADASSDRPAGEPGITNAQRRQLFALGTRLDMDIDDLRAATPLGSISALTRAEASDLIRRLSEPGGGCQAQGTATARQIGAIMTIRGRLAFTDAQFAAWAGKRFGVSSIAQIRDRSLASRMIGGLAAMYEKRSRGAGHGREVHPAQADTGTSG